MQTKKVNQTFHLRTNDPDKTLKFTVKELFRDFSFRCLLDVFSNGFGCKLFVYFDNLQEFISDLQSMDESLSGKSSINGRI